jgi:sterol desaturase/sphingolipid hydroxylase (fatty acid hydroxylase superfamily)
VNTLAVCSPRLRIQPVRSQLVICGRLLHPQAEGGPRRGAKQPTRLVVVVVVVVVVVAAVIVIIIIIIIIIAAAFITVVVVIIIFVVVIIIIIIITFMQCIYTYIPETNHVSCVYNVVAILYLRFVVHVTYFVF